ncbi:siderophore ABC transporter substrate-binding protein [Cohnella lubricantis]|uniref:Siderophore ABC transporter substrate-binding protein n=1 Tax=Cohnella lubricantis TaxID=2163172 RepID=A0A841TFR3_9BACL|nr:siderophore ABC transporter substrate-binding protein [Cohnella lubricantis]MBB6678935.1 siderophore ABC transporter substrate-binding protein [Cohnella lubricantis]MBP2118847.1 iron complex transport system substrate-binding protein [Cohnella lubricantis]
MRKTLSILLASALTLAVLSGCGANNANNTNGAAAPAQASAPSASASASSEASPNEAAAPAEITVKHASGETTVKTNPAKVVVFDFGSLDTLDKLGIEVTGVPQSNLPSYLKKFEDSKYENVGGLMEPDFEKIAEIQPDLIIISGRQAASYDEFKKIAPTINLALDTTKYLDSFKANLQTIGQIFGKQAEADAEAAAIDATIQSVHDEAAATGKSALIVLANEGKISAYGAGSRFGLIHDVLGFKPADDKIEVSTHGQSVSFEYVAEKNPDYLFVIDRGAVVAAEGAESQPAQKVIENELVKRTNAYKDGHIIYLDPNFWYLSGGGLVSVSEMVKEVEAGI